MKMENIFADTDLLKQMKSDLEIARAIVNEHKGTDVESLVLSGIFAGREMEYNKMYEQLLLLGVKIPNNVNSLLTNLNK